MKSLCDELGLPTSIYFVAGSGPSVLMDNLQRMVNEVNSYCGSEGKLTLTKVTKQLFHITSPLTLFDNAFSANWPSPTTLALGCTAPGAKLPAV